MGKKEKKDKKPKQPVNAKTIVDGDRPKVPPRG